jgi:hypothetical protein
MEHTKDKLIFNLISKLPFYGTISAIFYGCRRSYKKFKPVISKSCTNTVLKGSNSSHLVPAIIIDIGMTSTSVLLSFTIMGFSAFICGTCAYAACQILRYNIKRTIYYKDLEKKCI